MSKFEDGSYQCLPGPALIAKVLAGRCQMRYTRAAVGKGTLPEGVSPKELTEPPEYVMDAMISAVTNPVAGECQVTVQINSSNVEAGFYANYIILYAEDPDEGEVPYTCLKTEDGLEWIRPKTSAIGKIATFDMIAAVGDVDAVSAVIDPEAIITAAEVQQLIQEHNDDPDAHGGSIGGGVRTVEITIPATGWTANTEPNEDPNELHVDVPIEDVNGSMTPDLNIHPAYKGIAKRCGFSNDPQAMDGLLRVYAVSEPEGEIVATLALLNAGGGRGGGSYILPKATAYTLGGAKIGAAGSGLKMSPDGVASVDWSDMDDAAAEAVAAKAADKIIPSPEEVSDMLDQTLTPYEPGQTPAP